MALLVFLAPISFSCKLQGSAFWCQSIDQPYSECEPAVAFDHADRIGSRFEFCLKDLSPEANHPFLALPSSSDISLPRSVSIPTFNFALPSLFISRVAVAMKSLKGPEAARQWKEQTTFLLIWMAAGLVSCFMSLFWNPLGVWAGVMAVFGALLAVFGIFLEMEVAVNLQVRKIFA